jgi:hypothetical protein
MFRKTIKDVPLITTPCVQREQFNNNTLINQNEQSLSLRVSGDGLELEIPEQFSKCKY